MSTGNSDNSTFERYRGSLVLIALAAFVVVCAGVKLAAAILVPIVLGGFIATVNVPLVFWLYRRRFPLTLAVGAALVADAVVLGAFSSLLIASAARLSDKLPLYLSRLVYAEERLTALLERFHLQARLYEIFDPVSIVGMMAALAGDIAVVLTDLVLALIIAAFLLFRFAAVSADRSRAPVLRTERVRRAVREMYRYIAIKTVTSMATGVLIGLWLWAIDADLPILFGLLAFLLNYIPTLGSIVAGLLAFAVGLIQHGPEHAALVAAGYLVVNIVIGNVIEPRVMGRALGLWPLVVLLSVVFWGWMLGIIGAVLSALLTQAVKVLLLATPDLRPVGLALGPQPKEPATRASQADLLDEAMPQSVRQQRPSSPP